MLSYHSENCLKQFLVAVADGERTSECLRQRLCNIRDFAPHAAFQRVDRDANNKICSREVLSFLRDHHDQSATELECYHLVRFFDSDNDGSLSF